jgi:hypothetical protein
MIRQRKPFKPRPTPSWVVGRDFPDPNERAQGTVPTIPSEDSPRGGPFYPEERRVAPPAVRPPSEPSLQPPPTIAQDFQPPPADLRRGGPLAPPAVRPLPESSTLPPIPKTQNVRPPSEPPQPAPDNVQPQSPNPPKTHPPAAKSNRQPHISNFHSGKCSICNHPDRAEIEAAFLDWEPAQRIAEEFQLPARSTIYRHAKAANLLEQRRKNLLAALDQIIERAAQVPPTGSTILRAIELSARLASGSATPLKRYEITHKYIHEPAPASERNAGSLPAPVPQSTATVSASGVAASQPPNSESGPSPEQQSGHQNIVAEPNSLIPKEAPPKQSGHIQTYKVCM